MEHKRSYIADAGCFVFLIAVIAAADGTCYCQYMRTRHAAAVQNSIHKLPINWAGDNKDWAIQAKCMS